MSPDDANPPTVVCVDDDRMVLDLLTTMLDRVGEFRIEGFTDPDAALFRIRSGDTDCVVSDYEMPELDGLELMERSRVFDPDLPFILYTGRGCEDIATEAVSRGVTDYLRKERGTAQYARLGNRVEEAVARYHAERETDRNAEALEAVREGICIVREDGTIEYANAAYRDLYGYSAEELDETEWQDLHSSQVSEHVLSEVLPAVEDRGEWTRWGVGRRADGTTFRQRTSIRALPGGGLVVVTVDLEDRPGRGDERNEE